MTTSTPPNLPQAPDFPAHVPAEVIAAVQQLYRAFAHHPRPTSPLNACTECCMAPELEAEMRSLPLRALSAHHICAYQDAAHDADQADDEYAYFLPRVAELLSHGHPELVRHSTEIALDRLGICARDGFSDSEYAAIAAWSMALWAWYLRDGSLVWQGTPPLLREDADALIVMFAVAGVPLAPLLGAWVQADSDWALLQYALLAHAVDQSRSQFSFFVDKLPELGNTLHAWAFSSDVHRVFAQRWAAMSDARANALLEHSCRPEEQLLEVLGPRPGWLK